MVPWLSLLVMERRGRSEQNGKRWVTGAMPPSPFIAGEGQPATPTIIDNDGFSLHAAGTHQIGQFPRQRGEAETPMSNQPPHVDQGRRLLGPVVLRPCPLASTLSQVRARLRSRGYRRHSENGGPQTCLPPACSMAQQVAQHGPSTSTQVQDPREGPSLAERTTQGFLRGGLTRQACEEAERSRQGYLARCS